MHIVEKDQYQVSCYIDRADMKQYGVISEDFVNRTPLAMMLIGKARQLAKESTDYEWPGCAFSMEMKFYSECIELVFSERIQDFVYNLEQSVLALPDKQGKELQRLIHMISLSETETDARNLIREFEKNVQQV